MAQVSIFIALLAGLVSFLSPCILPLMPGFIAYLSGTTPQEAKDHRSKVFLHSVFFVLGFSIVFAVVGVLLHSVLEAVAYDVQIWLARLGGLIIVLFGLHLTGLIKIPFLNQEKKVHLKKKEHNTYFGSTLFGAAFAVGWSPCVGIILGSILALAISTPGLAFTLLLAYAIGLGVPFLLLGLFTAQAMNLIKRSATFFKYFNIVVGILLIIMGLLVVADQLTRFSGLFSIAESVLQ